MSTYAVKELFRTLQGEGANTGRVAVFCRFTGCNLWSGREQDRSKGPGGCSAWCDTNFVGVDGHGGGKFQSAAALATAAKTLWDEAKDPAARPLVVCTGGEPMLQLDGELIDAFHEHGFEVAVETNGTIPVPDSIDWVCVSPKANSELLVTRGNELKLVHPQEGIDPQIYLAMDFEHFYLQPKDGPYAAEARSMVLRYCLENPRWRFGLQSHKVIGID